LSFASAQSAEEIQISNKDILGWIIALVAVLPPTIGLFYTAKQLKYDSNSKFIQTLREVDVEITNLEIEDDRFADDGTPIRKDWESRFLNTMERNAFLLLSKRFPDDLLEDFENDFAFALYLINKIKNRKTRFKRIVRLCSEKGWKEYNADNQENLKEVDQ
jgi:hypothetical protein